MNKGFCCVIFLFHAFRQFLGVFSSSDFGAVVQTSGSLAYWQADSEDELLGGDLNSRLQRPSLRFEPSRLDFGDQPIGVPQTRHVFVSNRGPTVIQLLSISGSTRHLHCSFFQDKSVPTGANTSFEVLFLAREEGPVTNTLSVQTSLGKVTYQVTGVGVASPYRLHPLVGVRIPLNSTFSSLIHLHNPHGTSLQVEEVYSSGGDFHLELPTGEKEAPKDLWALSPYETKPIMKAFFLGQREANHTAFIRIRTSGDNKFLPLIIPFEVEVSSTAGIYATVEKLDFGILRAFDEPKALRLNLLNSGSEPIYISNITVYPHNPAVSVSFRPMYLRPDILQPATVAFVSYFAGVTDPSNDRGSIIIHARGYQPLQIPYSAQVLHGDLLYEKNQTLFYTGDAVPQNISRKIAVTNVFNCSLVLYNITLSNEIRHLFTIENFSHPVILLPQKLVLPFRLKFHPNISHSHIHGNLYLHTNASVFTIPVHTYNGRLKVVHHRPEVFKGQLDFGTLAVYEKRNMSFTVRNDNPVDVNIKRLLVNMENTFVELRGVEKGNGTMLTGEHNISAIDINSMVLKPYHFAVFSVSLTAPAEEGTYAAEVIFITQFEDLYIPITLRTAEGSLNAVPDKVLIERCFPGKTSYRSLKIHSSFNQPMELRHFTIMPNDTRFYYIPPRETPVILESHRDNYIGRLYFDPKRECGEDCYVGLPTFTSAGHHWLLGATLDRDVTDTDLYLYTRYQQKWLEYGFNQQTAINITVQLDTSQVRGFLFPAQAQLYWPLLARKNRLKFPLTHIGNYSVSDFILENPADVPIIVQILPLALYPSPHSLLEILGSRVVLDADDVIESADPDVFRVEDMTFSDSSSASQPHPDLRRSIENTLGVRPHPLSVSAILPAGMKARVKLSFHPKQHVAQSSVIIIRNNLTIIEEVVVQGSGGLGELRFSNRRPGSPSPLLFQLTEKNLKSCDGARKRVVRSIPPTFTVRRTFTLRNTGQLPFDLLGYSINEWPCEGYGFKVLECEEFTMEPNASRKVDIAFTPDFTMSRIRRTLSLHTSLGQNINYTLQATVPAYMLSRCAAALPRPSWEPALFYFVLCLIIFIILCLLCAAYFEADRIFVADICQQRSRQYERGGKIFDLKSIAGLKAPDGSHLIMPPRHHSGTNFGSPDFANGHVYSPNQPSHTSYGYSDSYTSSSTSQQPIYVLLRSSPSRVSLPNNSLPSTTLSSHVVSPQGGLQHRTAANVGSGLLTNRNPSFSNGCVYNKPEIGNRLSASNIKAEATNNRPVQTSVVVKLYNTVTELFSFFHKQSSCKENASDTENHIQTATSTSVANGIKLNDGKKISSNKQESNCSPMNSLNTSSVTTSITSTTTQNRNSVTARQGSSGAGRSAASAVSSVTTTPVVTQSPNVSNSLPLSKSSDGSKRKSVDRTTSKMNATSSWLASLTPEVTSNKKDQTSSESKSEGNRLNQKRSVRKRGSSLPRDQSDRLNKECIDKDDSSSTTTESSNQDIEDNKSSALPISSSSEENAKQTTFSQDVVKKPKKKPNQDDKSLTPKSEYNNSKERPNSANRKIKREIMSQVDDITASSSLELPYTTELEARSTRDKDLTTPNLAPEKPHKKSRRSSNKNKANRAFGGSDRVAPRPSLRRSSSLRGEVPSRTPPPSWDMPSSAAEADLNDLAYQTASFARNLGQTSPNFTDSRQLNTSPANVAGSRADSVSYSSVVSGRNTNSPTNSSNSVGSSMGLPDGLHNIGVMSMSRSNVHNGQQSSEFEFQNGLQSCLAPRPGHYSGVMPSSFNNQTLPAVHSSTFDELLQRHITEQRPMDGNNDFVSSSSYQSQQSVNFLHRMFLNHRPNDMSSERDASLHEFATPFSNGSSPALQQQRQIITRGRDGALIQPPQSSINNNWLWNNSDASTRTDYRTNSDNHWSSNNVTTNRHSLNDMTSWPGSTDNMWLQRQPFSTQNQAWGISSTNYPMSDMSSTNYPMNELANNLMDSSPLSNHSWVSSGSSSLWTPSFSNGANNTYNSNFYVGAELSPEPTVTEPTAFYTANMEEDGEFVDSMLPPYDPLGRSIWSASETAGMNNSGSGWSFIKSQESEMKQ